MKTSKKYTKEERKERRLDLLEARAETIARHRRAGRWWLRSKTKVRTFKKGWRGEYSVSEYGKYPFASTRQKARFAMQLAAGKIKFK